MAVVTPKSTQITNADATPVVFSQTMVDGGLLKEKCAIVAVANGDSIASIIRLVRVRSDARISELKLYCTAITSAAGDIGLYRTAADGGAVVDVDFFASAQSLASVLGGTDVTMEAAAGPAVASNIEKRIWEALGLSADPLTFYDVAITLTAAAAAAGTVGVKLRYVGGE